MGNWKIRWKRYKRHEIASEQGDSGTEASGEAHPTAAFAENIRDK